MTDLWITGDAASLPIPDKSVNCCVTSPPYFGLRDYGVEGQIGLEPTPDEFVARLVAVFREVRRVLTDDGTLWLNLGDSYAANRPYQVTPTKWPGLEQGQSSKVPDGMKPKDLIGIPWMVAFALRADGWYLRSDVIWHKPNPMPESVTDRPTKAHEYLFLLSKSQRYYYDHAAIAEPADPKNWRENPTVRECPPGQQAQSKLDSRRGEIRPDTRNRRSVWTVTTQPFAEAHFATMPPELVRPCILAGCPKDGVVLDPFGGAGTVPLVARQEGRGFVYNDLNPAYRVIAERRLFEVHHQPRLFGAA